MNTVVDEECSSRKLRRIHEWPTNESVMGLVAPWFHLTKQYKISHLKRGEEGYAQEEEYVISALIQWKGIVLPLESWFSFWMALIFVTACEYKCLKYFVVYWTVNLTLQMVKVCLNCMMKLWRFCMQYWTRLNKKWASIHSYCIWFIQGTIVNMITYNLSWNIQTLKCFLFCQAKNNSKYFVTPPDSPSLSLLWTISSHSKHFKEIQWHAEHVNNFYQIVIFRGSIYCMYHRHFKYCWYITPKLKADKCWHTNWAHVIQYS